MRQPLSYLCVSYTENILLEENKDFDDLKVIDFGLAEYGEAFSAMEGSSYYVSPQVVQGQYGPKTDVWSCGVIAFVCLAGYAPFEGADEDEVLQSVLDGYLDFDDPVWDDITEEARDFVAFLLTYEESERPSAEEALQHPWLKSARSRRSRSCSKRRESTRTSLGCLQSFQADSKLKQCVCSLIASQLLRKDEKEEIDIVFRSLDFDCDGKLTKEDVKQSYTEFFGEELSDGALDLMFQQVNFSGSGAIEYSEFVASTLMEQKLVDDTKLMAAFKMFDRDDKGYISNTDLKDVLSLDDDMEDYIIHKLIHQVDHNNDGKIQFEEFQDMMCSSGMVPISKATTKSNLSLRGNAMGSSTTGTTFSESDRLDESGYSDDDQDELYLDKLNASETSLSFKAVLDKFQKTRLASYE
jgi:calcium-dependent protein kinase